MNHVSKAEIKELIYECFKKLSNLYFPGWISAREIHEYILQETGHDTNKSGIANVMRSEMVGIKRCAVGDTKEYKDKDNGIGIRFINDVLGLNRNIMLYRINGE